MPNFRYEITVPCGTLARRLMFHSDQPGRRSYIKDRTNSDLIPQSIANVQLHKSGTITVSGKFFSEPEVRHTTSYRSAATRASEFADYVASSVFRGCSDKMSDASDLIGHDVSITVRELPR